MTVAGGACSRGQRTGALLCSCRRFVPQRAGGACCVEGGHWRVSTSSGPDKLDQQRERPVLPCAHGRFTVPLTAVRAVDLATAGGKGANLGELIAAGFDVPAGFVVTTDAYRHAVGPGPHEQASLGSLDVPPDVAEAIAGVRHLGSPAVAVRSAPPPKTLPGAAFAGQQDTYLGIVGERQLIDAVRDCWASLWTPRAISYRDRLGIDAATVAIAVVVQRLVPADHAGVMFTADPVTGARDRVVIDANPGLRRGRGGRPGDPRPRGAQHRGRGARTSRRTTRGGDHRPNRRWHRDRHRGVHALDGDAGPGRQPSDGRSPGISAPLKTSSGRLRGAHCDRAGPADDRAAAAARAGERLSADDRAGDSRAAAEAALPDGGERLDRCDRTAPAGPDQRHRGRPGAVRRHRGE